MWMYERALVNIKLDIYVNTCVLNLLGMVTFCATDRACKHATYSILCIHAYSYIPTLSCTHMFVCSSTCSKVRLQCVTSKSHSKGLDGSIAIRYLVSPVSFLKANPNMAIFLFVTVLKRDSIMRFAKRRFWYSFRSITWQPQSWRFPFKWITWHHNHVVMQS